MIQTITVPTARLGSDARLLLELPDGRPEAFTEAQLVFAIEAATRWCVEYIIAEGVPADIGFKRQGGRLIGWLQPGEIAGEEVRAKFAQCYDWLAYRQLAYMTTSGAVMFAGAAAGMV